MMYLPSSRSDDVFASLEDSELLFEKKALIPTLH